ncbi:MAG: peptidylprolyl isomerase [Candidatus Omnitrophica bacterium]|nr:peptidylprolyl isomerase [Candidatus Omnitrophota bacterium]
MKQMRGPGWRLIGAIAVVAALQPGGDAEEGAMAAAVQDNMDVGMEYTLTVDDAVVDSTEGKEPFHYIHGRRQVIPGLERQLAGMHAGDSAELTVAPEDGYGAVDPTAFMEIPKAQLPADASPEIGMVLRGVNPDGQQFRARISELKGENVVLDLNHPLAGKTLTFKVKILDITPVPAS